MEHYYSQQAHYEAAQEAADSQAAGWQNWQGQAWGAEEQDLEQEQQQVNTMMGPRGFWVSVPVPVYMFMQEGTGSDSSAMQMPCAAAPMPVATGPFYDDGTGAGASLTVPSFLAMAGTEPARENCDCMSIRTPSPDPAEAYAAQAGFCDQAAASCMGLGSMASTTESDRLSEQLWISEENSISSQQGQQSQQQSQQQHCQQQGPSQQHSQGSQQGRASHPHRAQAQAQYTSSYQQGMPTGRQQMPDEAAEYHHHYNQDSMAPGSAQAASSSTNRRRRRPIRTNAPVVPLRVARNSGAVSSSTPGSSFSRPSQATAAQKSASSAAASRRTSCFEALRGNVLKRAFDPTGSREVQEALHNLNRHEAAALASELQGHVQECVESPHANYVLSCAIEQLPSTDVHWAVEELLGDGVAVAVARHRYGCRVICRLMEHHPVFSPQNRAGCKLVDALVEAAVQLARNEFGRHTIIKLLDQGTDERRSQVTAALLTDLTSQARHRNASYVVESALEHAPQGDREALVANLMRPEELLLLAQCQSGCHVIRSLVNACSAVRSAVEEILARSLPVLANSKYGQLLARELGLLQNSGA